MYRLFPLQCNLEFFRMMLELYDRLATLHHLRVDVAIRWLEANGHLTQQAPSHLIPHSPSGLLFWNDVILPRR